MGDLKAVIFDMDGLLLDTERIALETFVSACRENGFEPDVTIYYRCIGTASTKTQEILKEGYGPVFPYEKVIACWREKYYEIVIEKSVPLKPAVLELLHFLDQNQMRKAVVTSSKYDTAIRELRNAGILNYFEFVLGGDQINRGKPHPEIYQKACHNLGLSPQSCLALEDSDNGVLSAAGAGLQVIQVKDLREPSPEVCALGFPVMDSLEEVQTYLKDRFSF